MNRCSVPLGDGLWDATIDDVRNGNVWFQRAKMFNMIELYPLLFISRICYNDWRMLRWRRGMTYWWRGNYVYVIHMSRGHSPTTWGWTWVMSDLGGIVSHPDQGTTYLYHNIYIYIHIIIVTEINVKKKYIYIYYCTILYIIFVYIYICVYQCLEQYICIYIYIIICLEHF